MAVLCIVWADSRAIWPEAVLDWLMAVLCIVWLMAVSGESS
jgi:hypothetical protein